METQGLFYALSMATWNKDSIKQLRKNLKLSQSEFAHQLGCRQQTVSEWEQGIYEPANAYTKLLENFVAATKTSWFSPGPKRVEEPVAEVIIEKDSEPVREFDPAID